MDLVFHIYKANNIKQQTVNCMNFLRPLTCHSLDDPCHNLGFYGYQMDQRFHNDLQKLQNKKQIKLKFIKGQSTLVLWTSLAKFKILYSRTFNSAIASLRAVSIFDFLIP